MQQHSPNQVLPPDWKTIRIIEKATTIDQAWIEAPSTSMFSWATLTLRRQFLKYYWSVPPLWRIAPRATLHLACHLAGPLLLSASIVRIHLFAQA